MQASLCLLIAALLPLVYASSVPTYNEFLEDGKHDFTPTHVWQLDDAHHDLSPNRHSLYAYLHDAHLTPGPFNDTYDAAIRLQGNSSSYVDIPNPQGQLDASSLFSWVMIIRPTTVDGEGVLLEYRDDSGLGVRLKRVGTGLVAEANDTTGQVYTIDADGANVDLEPNQWKFVTLTYKGYGEQKKFKVMYGVYDPDKNDNKVDKKEEIDVEEGTVLRGTGDVRIGASFDSALPAFAGDVTCLRYYNATIVKFQADYPLTCHPTSGLFDLSSLSEYTSDNVHSTTGVMTKMVTTTQAEENTKLTTESEVTTRMTTQPQETTSMTTQPEVTSRMTIHPEDTTSMTTQPEVTSRIIKHPEDTTSATTQPEVTSRMTTHPEDTTSMTTQRKVTSRMTEGERTSRRVVTEDTTPQTTETLATTANLTGAITAGQTAPLTTAKGSDTTAPTTTATTTTLDLTTREAEAKQTTAAGAGEAGTSSSAQPSTAAPAAPVGSSVNELKIIAVEELCSRLHQTADFSFSGTILAEIQCNSLHACVGACILNSTCKAVAVEKKVKDSNLTGRCLLAGQGYTTYQDNEFYFYRLAA